MFLEWSDAPAEQIDQVKDLDLSGPKEEEHAKVEHKDVDLSKARLINHTILNFPF